jgi:hypothetical protein
MDSTALEAILDVAIGMIFMWLILSVATMSVQEWIASYLKWRAKDLETAVRRLLGNSQLWAEHLYAHPLIQGLSKKTGKKPSYMPANKFALALYDVVTTAGTEQSFIQQQLLAAKKDIEGAPDQFFPFIGYLFKRFGKYISGLGYTIAYFFGSDRGRPEHKFEELLKLTQKLFSQSPSAALGELQQKLKEFFLEIINDKTKLQNGKVVSTPSADFLNTYPTFKDSILDLLNIILESQPILKMRWAEIIVYNDEKLIANARKELEEGQTLREKLRELIQEKAENFNLEKEDIELIITSIKQTLDEMDFLPAVNRIQELIGNTQGVEALQALNPPLYKSLMQLRNDTIGIANTPEMLEAVRNRFALAAANIGQEEHKLATMRLNAETWFNESMDRLSGWYKRKATILAFAIGLVLAAILNVDSIALSQHLWREPAVRKALAANATEFANENTEIPTLEIEDGEVDTAVEYFNAQFKDLNIPLGWDFTSVELEPGESCSLIAFGKNRLGGFYAEVPAAQLGENVENGNLIEANVRDQPRVSACQQISNFPSTAAGVFLKIMGIILSAIAAAQGSPFWFDILKKVVNIRGSGANPNEKK